MDQCYQLYFKSSQSAVLGMHNILKGQLLLTETLVRPVMYLAYLMITIIDGKEAVSFLKIVKESLEQPKRLFLNI